MKLFAIEPKYEGHETSFTAMLVIGRKYDSKANGEYVRNGWHIVINLPFVTKVISNFLDPNTFEYREAKCFWRLGAMCRRIRGNEKYSIIYSKVWCPVEHIPS